MARRRDRRNIPSLPVKAVNDKAESYEGDDEGRDESPPATPGISKGKLDNGAPAPQLDASEVKSAETTDPAKETPKKIKKGAKLNNGVATEESEPTPESSKRNRKVAKLDNVVASVGTEHAASSSKKTQKGKSKKEEEYEVEQIVGMEVNFRWPCPVRFQVRWVGYTEKDDTWVSVYSLNCENFVEDFLSISGRTSEYEKAMERAEKSAQRNTEVRESLRKRGRPEYCEDSDGEEVMMTTTTRTRKTRRPDMFDPADAGPQLSKINKKKAPKVGVSRAHALAQQAGREYEVVLITDQRVKGRFTEYKVRWKGLASSHDSWVPEADLTCPKLIADYLESIESAPEQEYEVAAIIDTREVDGDVSYKVRWKGFSAKFDSWLPKDEMNCPEMIKKFEDALEKLNKKVDWVKKKKTQNVDSDQSEEEKIKEDSDEEEITERERSPKKKKKKTTQNVDSDQSEEEKIKEVSDEEEITERERSPKKKKKKTTQNVDSDQSEEEKIKEDSDGEEITERERSAKKKTKKTRQNVDGDQSEKEEENIKEDSDEEEITVKKSKNKRKKGSSPAAKQSPAAQSKDSRKRRISLPVSYEEDDNHSE